MQASRLFERALILDEQVGHLAEKAIILNNIGESYRHQKKLEQALPYYERALTINKQLNNPVRIAATLDNIGHIYQAQGKWEQAIEQYSRALRLYESLGLGFEADSADELEALAACHSEMGEQEKSSSYLDRAQHIRKGYFHHHE